ncbi:Lysoplasmalogenase-like protein TMEM86A [Holothuria leucospilota]|uniref:lysoplasmalogenase n=1 Tax=Holothuria leucospilota TaxID=206669 RepID=A0A9Q0YKH1_HOLLE|nr:Lysoplasmalogenase-like protein TMEM86A [Holothuria leucospilota]
MVQITSIVKSVGPRLLPFFKTSLLFFLLKPYESGPSVYLLVVKCLPIICLCGFVITYIRGVSMRQRYSLCILAGLVLSCFGDACLVFYKQYFIHGLLFFAFAHVLYIMAFGAQPLKLPVAIVMSFFAASSYAFLYPGLKQVMVWLCLIYVILIFTMFWRAVARIHPFENMWTWTKMCACIGALLFIISDFCIAVDKFRFAIPYRHQIIMSTYYSAQLGIALSVAETPQKHNDKEDNKKK